MVLKLLRSRRFAKRTLIALTILIIPVFVLWGVGSVANRPLLIGTIDKKDIRYSDLERSRQGVRIQLLFAYYGNFEALNNILKNRTIINYMAWERLILLNEAKKRRIKIDDSTLASFISQHPVFQRGGSFDKTLYNYILRNNFSLEPQQFEDLARENLAIQFLRQILLKDITTTDQELLDYYKKVNSKLDFTYVVIEKDPFLDQVSTNPDEIKNLYEANRDNIFEPEKADIEYIESSYYDNTEQKNAITANLEKIRPEFEKDSSKFEEISKKYGLRYGRTGEFSPLDVIPGIAFFKDFQDTSFSLKEGETSSIIFSNPDRGTAYILHKVKHIPRRYKTLEEVEDEIKKAIIEQKAILLAVKKGEGLQGQINEDKITFEQIAQDLKQEIKTCEGIDVNGYIENIGPAKDIVIRSWEVDFGKIIPPVAVKNGAFLGKAIKATPPDETDFEKQKETIQKNLLAQKQMNAIEDWLRDNSENVELRKDLKEL